MKLMGYTSVEVLDSIVVRCYAVVIIPGESTRSVVQIQL
jgi:hypothetical protein